MLQFVDSEINEHTIQCTRMGP